MGFALSYAFDLGLCAKPSSVVWKHLEKLLTTLLNNPTIDIEMEARVINCFERYQEAYPLVQGSNLRKFITNRQKNAVQSIVDAENASEISLNQVLQAVRVFDPSSIVNSSMVNTSVKADPFRPLVLAL